ncbi:MAG: dihydroorotate dehydrogenase electron transfer subunit [Anaeroplasmataceae bacterium]|nr:dihydroorotate dehydrogenase electron transfer subunit [Anaeroplasmataceae bacterium]
MKNVILKIKKNEQISDSIYKMVLEGPIDEIKRSGEFIEIELPKYYLRRPFSVSRINENSIEILYKVLGHGTYDMTTYRADMELSCLIGLGNGFDCAYAKQPLLIAGGIGIAPMFALAEDFIKRGIKPIILYGAQDQSDLVCIEELKKLGQLILCTDNGSLGFHGNPVQYLKENLIHFDFYYACGPVRMLEALKEHSSNGCLSLEARMGCGFGACMGCSIKTINGPKRVCKEGPVFLASEVIFS